MAYLAAIAANKVKTEIRRLVHSQKYDIRRERSINDSARSLEGVLHSAEATASDIAIARERWFQLLADQPEHYRKIVQMRYTSDGFEK